MFPLLWHTEDFFLYLEKQTKPEENQKSKPKQQKTHKQKITTRKPQNPEPDRLRFAGNILLLRLSG